MESIHYNIVGYKYIWHEDLLYGQSELVEMGVIAEM